MDTKQIMTIGGYAGSDYWLRHSRVSSVATAKHCEAFLLRKNAIFKKIVHWFEDYCWYQIWTRFIAQKFLRGQMQRNLVTDLTLLVDWLRGYTCRVPKNDRPCNFHLFFAYEVEMGCNDARQARACMQSQNWGRSTSASHAQLPHSRKMELFKLCAAITPEPQLLFSIWKHIL